MDRSYGDKIRQIMQRVVRETEGAGPLALCPKGWGVTESSLGELSSVIYGEARLFVLNKSLSVVQKREILAHDSIHVQIHGRMSIHPCHGEMKIEAEAGARELLLPYDQLRAAGEIIGVQWPRTEEEVYSFAQSSEGKCVADFVNVSGGLFIQRLHDWLHDAIMCDVASLSPLWIG